MFVVPFVILLYLKKCRFEKIVYLHKVCFKLGKKDVGTLKCGN